ncbi:hypothetical protein V7124_03985 [Neobacillus niacini]|uniref:hypothetical protein n=1 Tax=Neobacillus niacini TaxID=86668 RepID=UPI003000DE66
MGLRVIIVFVVTIICMISIVIKSSGVSQFYADRDVSMQIADSKNAFIVLPELINLNIDVLKLSTNYYSKEMKFQRTEETMAITDVDHNLTIKNNMDQPIYLEQIFLENLDFQLLKDAILLDIGENTKVDLTNGTDGNGFMIPNDLTTESNATFYFRWNNGNMAVQKNVLVNMTINEEAEDQIEGEKQ